MSALPNRRARAQYLGGSAAAEPNIKHQFSSVGQSSRAAHFGRASGRGLAKRQSRRGTHRKRRQRRPLPGILIHIDASQHQWFSDERWHDLIAVLDDATSRVYYAQLVEQESTRVVMQALREVVEGQGIFCSLYSDRGALSRPRVIPATLPLFVPKICLATQAHKL